ncbi:helix-turn-helix transcriptional regulator [Sphingomonas mali]|uniref:helix-turn-helix transcriptional regulator n=1 Tax=Sphingomonas mali TaxID=40682 RepID=UPI00082FB490|nr:AlpA family phage regulatory protein [Sphingomonas mali]
MPTDTPDRILRLNAVLDRTGLSRSTLYRKVQTGTFPKQARNCFSSRKTRLRAKARHGRSALSSILS